MRYQIVASIPGQDNPMVLPGADNLDTTNTEARKWAVAYMVQHGVCLEDTGPAPDGTWAYDFEDGTLVYVEDTELDGSCVPGMAL